MGCKPCPAPPPPEGGSTSITFDGGAVQPIRGQCTLNKDKNQLTCIHDPQDNFSGTQLELNTIAKTSSNLRMSCQQHDLSLPGDVTAICQNNYDIWTLSMIGPKDNKNPVFACGGPKGNMCIIPDN